MSDTLWPQHEWDARYVGVSFRSAAPSDPIRIWLEKTFSGRSRKGTCLELGCFPGQFLSVFGALGFELNGIDLTPRVDQDLGSWLRSDGYQVGEIIRGDFFEHRFGRLFDVVCSFGLIEHFPDWPRAIRRHAELVTPGGYLVITTPNFRGCVQQFLHRVLDQENLARHNLDAMNPKGWAEECASIGFDVLDHGYLGRFDFWAEPQERSLPAQAALKVLRKITPRVAPFAPMGLPSLAPFCKLLARRPAD